MTGPAQAREVREYFWWKNSSLKMTGSASSHAHDLPSYRNLHFGRGRRCRSHGFPPEFPCNAQCVRRNNEKHGPGSRVRPNAAAVSEIVRLSSGRKARVSRVGALMCQESNRVSILDDSAAPRYNGQKGTSPHVTDPASETAAEGSRGA